MHWLQSSKLSAHLQKLQEIELLHDASCGGSLRHSTRRSNLTTPHVQTSVARDGISQLLLLLILKIVATVYKTIVDVVTVAAMAAAHVAALASAHEQSVMVTNTVCAAVEGTVQSVFFTC